MTPPMLSLQTFMPYRLSIASNAVSELVATAYEALFALKVPEWRLIAVLAEDGPQTQQALTRVTRMDKISVSRATRAILKRGLVTRRIHPADARARLVSLSPAGQSLYAQVAPKALEIEARLLAGLSKAEQSQLGALLARLDAAAERLKTELDPAPKSDLAGPGRRQRPD